MSTAIALSAAGRTVLDVLNNSSGSTSTAYAVGASENLLMAYAGVDRDVIYDLVDREYVTAPHRWALTYGLERGSPGYVEHIRCCVEQYRKEGDAFLNFRITPAGTAWVQRDPLSVLLRSVWTTPRRQLRLHEALGFSDRDTIGKAVEGGYLTLHYVDGHPTSRCGDYEFRHPHDFYLAGTAKTRNVLG
jgi:hypothetical protein